MRHRSAPIIRFLNVSGQAIRERDADGGSRYFSPDAVLEVRPESEKLTDRQQEKHRELIDRFCKDQRLHRLPDREASPGEDETPAREPDQAAPERMEQRARVEGREQFVGALERRRRERIVLSSR